MTWSYITDSTGADYDHWKCIETKDKMKYTFGKDGYLRLMKTGWK